MDFENNNIEQQSWETSMPQKPVKPEKQVKLWQSIIMLVVVALIIFVFEAIAYYFLGFYATALGEVLMMVAAVLTVVFAGAKLKPVFQFRKPEWKKVFGTILFWIGCYLFTIMIASIMEYFFPAEMVSASEGLTEGIMSVEMIPALLIVSLSPAVCEEMVFRGTFFNAVWNKTHKKWVTIVVVGIVFGIFHGSVWRFVPTCILGIAMGYILFETNNMFYNMLFHAVNNGVPILMMFLAGAYDGVDSELDAMLSDPELYRMQILPAIGLYMMIAGLGVALIYIGRNMIKYRDPYIHPEILMQRKKKERFVLYAIMSSLVLFGFVIMVVSLFLQGDAIMQTIESVESLTMLG